MFSQLEVANNDNSNRIFGGIVAKSALAVTIATTIICSLSTLNLKCLKS